MNSRFRLLSIVVLALLLLAVPGVGLAADPQFGSGGGAGPNGGGGTPPTLVPGASVLTVGIADSYAYSSTAGATIVGMPTSAGYFWYNSAGMDVLTSLRLPAGATIWQIDTYGYRTGTGTQTWYLYDENPMVGGTMSVAGTATSPSGTGVLQATMTFTSGLTLAVGHHWLVDLPTPTSNSSGYVGAIVQYTLPTLSFVPIAPVRVFDSRCAGMGGRMVTGAPRTINVKDAINPATCAVATPNAIPQGAKAISFNITVTGTINAGYIDVLPGTATTVTGSTINWISSGSMLANGGIVSLGTGTAERQVTLVMVGPSASADVIVDITGYYQ